MNLNLVFLWQELNRVRKVHKKFQNVLDHERYCKKSLYMEHTKIVAVRGSVSTTRDRTVSKDNGDGWSVYLDCMDRDNLPGDGKKSNW